jgi:predicted ATP-dependent Lon-type protease
MNSLTVIAHVNVKLNKKIDIYEANFSNLGIKAENISLPGKNRRNKNDSKAY